MDKIVNRKQQLRLFLTELISFMVIFSILGLIIFARFQQSTYANIDKGLEQRAAIVSKKPMLMDRPSDFKTITIYYDKNGKILNRDSLQRFSASILKVKGQTKDLNKTFSKQVGKATMRGVYVKVNADTQRHRLPAGVEKRNNIKNNDFLKNAKYAMVLQNITPDLQGINRFKNLLLAALILFGLLVFIISYIVSRINMKPVLKAWQQQQDFVDSAAHEIRTPLTIIQNQLEGLMTKPNDTIKDQIDPIIMSLSEIRRLNGLTSDMLTLARANSNAIAIKKTSVVVPEFMSEVLDPYQEFVQSEDKQFVIKTETTQSVMLDTKRINQLLVILLDNAAKYTMPGDTITVRTVIENNSLKIQVMDTGQGISDANKKRIFDRFYREERSGNKETGGNGLGLAIAAWIIKAHNGRIKVTDNPGGGSIFTVVLPIK
ncbi:sensor histidine kinase [Secundilactobacillus malefermentans]|uniref:sensor histidine kinase n=1 Tax=Secundilactobacillus malefermentans TaxID=176292 RepID=UPI0011CCB42A|nr:HAMP domain-containing sensor histidine kinase [Secundilactobacillus malefermentans]QEA31441.1 HAMP domain-containing histidine kinase [Secundilactobacillus malefermentans]